jgi:hypothetical protein
MAHQCVLSGESVVAERANEGECSCMAKLVAISVLFALERLMAGAAGILGHFN